MRHCTSSLRDFSPTSSQRKLGSILIFAPPQTKEAEAKSKWIPAFAGMTSDRFQMNLPWLVKTAGMTSEIFL